jgi:hypothetical protein
MTHTEYFGVLKNTYAAERRQIEVLGVFEPHPKHEIQVPANGFQDFIGPTNCVHWYLNDADKKGDFERIAEGSPVRFRCDEHTSNPDESKDRRRVHFMHVEPYGAIVVPESLCNGWQSGEAMIPFKLPTCAVFILSADSMYLFGPWRINAIADGSLIIPRKPPTVYRYKVADVKGKFALQIFRHPTVPDISVVGVSEMPLTGEPIDVATPTQLSNWLKKKLDQVISAQRIKELDAAFPGWKKGLSEAVKDAKTDEQQRWKRVEQCLDSVLADAAAIEAISKTRGYLDAVALAVAAEVARHKEEIIAKAELASKKRTGALELEISELENHKNKIASQIEAEKSRFERASQDLASFRGALTNDFERLKAEAALLSNMLGNEIQPSSDRNPKIRHSLVISRENDNAFEVVDPERFLKSRFHPALADSMIGLSETDARNAFATVVGSRVILLPDTKWFFALCKAFNAQGEIAYCDPRWLTWIDAWNVLGPMWQCEIESPLWKFILIPDFNVALPELWARPLLNVVGGFTDTLPNNSTWPELVRLFLVPTRGEASLPVNHDILTHCSSIKLNGELSMSAADSPGEFVRFRSGEVRRPLKHMAIQDVKLDVQSLARAPTLSEKVLKEIGIAFDNVLKGAAIDVSTISNVLREMGLEEDEAIDIALNMRCNWISTQEKLA